MSGYDKNMGLIHKNTFISKQYFILFVLDEERKKMHTIIVSKITTQSHNK